MLTNESAWTTLQSQASIAWPGNIEVASGWNILRHNDIRCSFPVISTNLSQRCWLYSDEWDLDDIWTTFVLRPHAFSCWIRNGNSHLISSRFADPSYYYTHSGTRSAGAPTTQGVASLESYKASLERCWSSQWAVSSVFCGHEQKTEVASRSCHFRRDLTSDFDIENWDGSDATKGDLTCDKGN